MLFIAKTCIKSVQKKKKKVNKVAGNTEESEAECSKCALETEINGNAVTYTVCEIWFDLKCANVSKTNIPEEYYCSDCV